MRGSELTGGLRWLPVCPLITTELPLATSPVLKVQLCGVELLAVLERTSRLWSALPVTSAVFLRTDLMTCSRDHIAHVAIALCTSTAVMYSRWKGTAKQTALL